MTRGLQGFSEPQAIATRVYEHCTHVDEGGTNELRRNSDSRWLPLSESPTRVSTMAVDRHLTALGQLLITKDSECANESTTTSLSQPRSVDRSSDMKCGASCIDSCKTPPYSAFFCTVDNKLSRWIDRTRSNPRGRSGLQYILQRRAARQRGPRFKPGKSRILRKYWWLPLCPNTIES